MADGVTSLMVACQRNESEKIKEILAEEEISASAVDKLGRVALHYCAERGDLDVFKSVFDADPSVMDKRDECGYTPLTFSVIGGNEAAAELLLEKGADVNNLDSEKHSLVHWATVCGHGAILTLLLKKGALASTPDLHGAHALHYATQINPAYDNGSGRKNTISEGMEILKILLKYGANVNCADLEERTPLLWAASSGNCEALLALLDAGADKHSFDKDHLTALHCAASRGHADVIRTLCRAAADVQVDARDRNGSTPLFYAAALGHVDALKALLDNKASVDLQDKKLRTAAHCAAAKGQVGVLKILRQYGASFSLENHRGDIVIHEAVQSGSQELIEWLLSLSSSYVNATNHDGRRPLHLSAALGHLDTCRLLVDKGAHKNALMLSKTACVTALDLAEEKGHQSVVDYLKSIEAQHCQELTPASVVEEFKQHMATRKANSRSGEQKIFTTETQTEDIRKVDQGVATTASVSEDALLATASNSKHVRKRHRSKRAHRGVDTDKEASVADDLQASHETADRSNSAENLAKTATQLDKGNASTSNVDVAGGNLQKAFAENEKSHKHSHKHKHRSGNLNEKDKTKSKKPGEALDLKGHNLDNPISSSRTSAAASDLDTSANSSRHAEKPAETEDSEMIRKNKKSTRVSIENDNGPEKEYEHSENGKIRLDDESSAISSLQISGTNPSGRTVTGSVSASVASRSRRTDSAVDRFRVDWESSLRSSVKRYAEEKRIFQELANLKRMQIQYGKVQEDVIVRRLIDDFLRGYNVHPGDFQVSTFNAWEKFLYDQLKILYRKEKESLVASYETKLKNQTSLFDQRLHNASGSAGSSARRRIPDDKIDYLSRTYGIAPIPMQYSPRLYKPSFMSGDTR